MIYTFYSYKGGVGRSMALANVAELFYRAGLKVLMVDWDLEAPGLERFFDLGWQLEEVLDQPGVIDMLLRYKQQMAQELSFPEDEEQPLPFDKPDKFIVDIYPRAPTKGRLWLLPAGRRSKEHFADYAHAVHTFDWQDFYQNWEGELYFQWLSQQLAQMADVVLIDSRTGVTEMGGVCTYQLADTVVMFCTPNQQSIDGTYHMARNFTNPRVQDVRRGRPLNVLIIPSRIERAESEFLNEFQDEFLDLFKQFVPKTTGIDIQRLWQLRIPYIPRYAYKETVAVLEEGRASAEDMIDAFVALAKVMALLAPLSSALGKYSPRSSDDSPEILLSKASEEKEPFLPSIFKQTVVPIQALAQTGIPRTETTYLTIGGGLGSFAWVDYLRIYGANPQQIMAIGLESKPYGRYQQLCRNSQLPLHERVTSSGSDSCPDNIWGWPGYAVREIWHSLKQGDISHAIRVASQIWGEPTLAETYMPRTGDVVRSILREATRIGWDSIWRYGRVRAIRKTDDGRYVVLFSLNDPQQSQHLCLAPYVHISVGYPGVRFLPDLLEYRERTGNFKSVVNAFEEHDYIYRDLERSGGVVLIRGRGRIASRIIQRLWEARHRNNQIAILHLMRRPLAEGYRFGRASRVVDNHWEFQNFKWPKACWGGDLRLMLERASLEERGELLRYWWGGTTTANRREWRDIIDAGLREGWYQIRFGNVERIERNREGKLEIIIRGMGDIKDRVQLISDFMIDTTGFYSELDRHPLLRDLIEHYKLERNAQMRLHVANDFEMEGMRNQNGRMYASGVMTLGGPYAPVDSFLGLQYAAKRSVDSLTSLGAPGLRRLSPIRSVAQWLRWARGVSP